MKVFCIWPTFDPILAIFQIFRKFSLLQMTKNYLAIRSHCSSMTFYQGLKE